MSFHVLTWLVVATPLWLSLCLIAALAGVAWQMRKMMKRMDRHAESIAHMDDWADSVEQTLKEMEERGRRIPPAATAAPRSTMDLKRWWEK